MVVELVRKAKAGSAALYKVMEGSEIVGLLEKYNDTRTETHPWKAYLGWGMDTKFLGSFYPGEGGKPEAIRAIAAAR